MYYMYYMYYMYSIGKVRVWLEVRGPVNCDNLAAFRSKVLFSIAICNFLAAVHNYQMAHYLQAVASKTRLVAGG